jgi:diadenosine tetraphosphatase ApaH/serine/threonine PP2A family protein phosphatase
VHGCELFHGSPREPVWDYVLSSTAIDATFALTVEPLVLVGHTHFALAASLDDHLFGGLAPAGTTIEFGHDRWLVNPGSVGQPRDGDPRAAFLLLDLDAGKAEFARVEYAVERTQAEMRDLALPEQLAARLRRGI